MRVKLFYISNRRLLWSWTVLCCAMQVAAVDAQLVRAKDGAPLPTFEVATVKPSNSGGNSTHISTNDARYSYQNLTLRQIVKTAYGIRSNAQLIGGPDQILESRYDIEAKIDETQSAGMRKMSRQDQRRENCFLLQALLGDRFHLKVHFETKELPVYALVVTKGGPKLRVSNAQQNLNRPGTSVHSDAQKAEAISYEDLGLTSLTDMLAAQVEAEDRPVINETGLSEKYDWTLHWAPQGRAQPTADTDTGGPALFTALQEQLGLRLKSEKDAIETIVIDHIERPSEN